MFASLRDFIAAITEEDELRIIEGVDWNLEIGALNELLVKRRGSPAVLCDNIKGYPEGFRVLINALQTPKQLGWALNLGSAIKDKGELMNKWRQWYAERKRIAPQGVSEGPILENVDEGENVDIFKFPVPKWHEHDGGRFIGTADMVILRDPDTGWVNSGTYRVQVHAHNKVSIYAVQGKDADLIRRKYHDRGEPCPVVICCGQAPDLFFMSSSSIPYGLSELEAVGGLRGEAVKVIQGKSTGLPIPAEAEIALEGEWLPPKAGTIKEGPFGEWTGYTCSGLLPECQVLIKRVYYRNNPIILGAPPVKPPSYLAQEVQFGTRIWDELEQSGIPGIQGVNMLAPGGARFLCAVSVKTSYPGHGKQVARMAATCRTGGNFGRFTIAVDDDINVYDTDEVLWALATRCEPAQDLEILEGCYSASIDPLLHPEKRQKGDYTNSRGVIDATKPWSWRDSFPRVNEFSEEWRRKVLEKFPDLFGKE